MTHRLSQILVFLTFCLLFLGGLVTSTGSGLAVPDWPLSYGTLFPPMVGGIRFEHTHRVVASLVGLLSLMLVIGAGFEKQKKEVRRLAIASFGLVVLQGILGGLTVLHQLPAPISIFHASLGPIFFCSVVALAEVTSPEWRGGGARPFRRLESSATHFVFLQLLLGAVVRHTGAGIWFHVVSAFFVFLLITVWVSRILSASENPSVTRPALFLGALAVTEFFLGIGAFAFKRLEGAPETGLARVLFPTFHQTVGALLLALCVLLILRSRNLIGPRLP